MRFGKVFLYLSAPKNWEFGKVGARNLKQRRGAEAAHVLEHGQWTQFQKRGCPTQPKTNFWMHLGILSLFVCGCQCKDPDSGKKPNPKQKISINIEMEPQTLDSRRVRTLNDINLVRTFMDGLMRVGKGGTTELAIADNYSLSEDRKTYSFHLRDAKWSNGDPVKAQDFIYAWKKALSPDFHSDYTFLLYFIKNGKSIKQGLLPSSMLGVSAKDDYTLTVTLDQQVPFFLELLTLPIFFPINQMVEQTNSDWHKNADTFVCNGPFKPAEWRHNDVIVAEKNPSYWDAQAVSLHSMHMIMVSAETGLSMFQTHELDWSGSPYSSIPTDAVPHLRDQNMIKADPMLGTYWIRINTAKFPLSNENLRKALAVAINREEIVSHVTNGFQEPATGIVPTSLGLQHLPYFSDGNVNEAQEFLHLAIEKEAITQASLPELTLIYVGDTRNHKIAQAIQDQWRKALGIEVKLEALEGKVALNRIHSGDYQMAVGSWIADFCDPINFLEVFKTKAVGTNSTNWESLNYQKALEATYAATDSQSRLEELKRSEQIIMEEMPVIPIFHYTMLHVNNDRLKGVVLTDSGHIDFKWAYVEK